METGIYDNIPNEEYQEDRSAVSCTYLKRHFVNPRKARYGIRTETPALTLGSLLHTAILEPETLPNRYHPVDLARISERDKATQAAIEEAMGREVIKRADYDEARQIADTVWRHPVARDIIVPGKMAIEQSFWWVDEDTGVPCRSRADIVRPDMRLMADVKSTIDASPDAFSRIINDYKYHWQQAMYSDGYPQAGGFKLAGFIFIAVEKEVPYEVVCYEIEEVDIEWGRFDYKNTLQNFRACQEADRWPGYGPDTLHSIGRPEHARARDEIRARRLAAY
jgi:hypothetical protein